MVNEAGAASEGGWGPRQEGQQAGGRGKGGADLCRTAGEGEEEMEARSGSRIFRGPNRTELNINLQVVKTA